MVIFITYESKLLCYTVPGTNASFVAEEAKGRNSELTSPKKELIGMSLTGQIPALFSRAYTLILSATNAVQKRNI